MAEGTGRRLSADDRRRQLIGIGLQLLVTTPIHQLSVDAVAERAGISRSLLFHYFPTKHDFYAAVVRAAARRMLRSSEAPAGAPGDRLTALVAGIADFIERHRDPFLAIVRGAGGADPGIREIVDQARAGLAEQVLAELRATRAEADEPEPGDPALLSAAVHGWLAYAEEMTLLRTAPGATEGVAALDRERFVALLADALDALTGLDTRPGGGLSGR